MDLGFGIGACGAIPWQKSPYRMRADMRRFRATTIGHTVIMGHETYRSLGKPLVDRQNIVLTRDPTQTGDLYAHSIAEALDKATGEIFVIGGETIYKAFVMRCDRIEITQIDHTFGCDRFFPRVKLSYGDWMERDEENSFRSRICSLGR